MISRDYATRIFASSFFFVAIAGLIYLLLTYSDSMTEVLKGIVLILLGNLGPQAGVAWSRLADPDGSTLEKQERTIETLQAEVLSIRAQLAANEAAHLSRDEEQRRMISELLDRMNRNTQPGQKLIEDRTTT